MLSTSLASATWLTAKYTCLHVSIAACTMHFFWELYAYAQKRMAEQSWLQDTLAWIASWVFESFSFCRKLFFQGGAAFQEYLTGKTWLQNVMSFSLNGSVEPKVSLGVLGNSLKKRQQNAQPNLTITCRWRKNNWKKGQKTGTLIPSQHNQIKRKKLWRKVIFVPRIFQNCLERKNKKKLACVLPQNLFSGKLCFMCVWNMCVCTHV